MGALLGQVEGLHIFVGLLLPNPTQTLGRLRARRKLPSLSRKGSEFQPIHGVSNTPCILLSSLSMALGENKV